ncbi:unnamed protein product [Amoebophrya sp. A120]|nr:unnamed protein product [Amoebophrya sp. A120]|eukprot:GSA120T00023563001.1
MTESCNVLLLSGSLKCRLRNCSTTGNRTEPSQSGGGIIEQYAARTNPLLGRIAVWGNKRKDSRQSLYAEIIHNHIRG